MLFNRNISLRLRLYFFLAVFIIGFINTWCVRFLVDSDGIHMLDIGDSVFNGDWKAIINGSYNPLYSLITGFFLFIIKPSFYWESTIVHFVNFIMKERNTPWLATRDISDE